MRVDPHEKCTQIERALRTGRALRAHSVLGQFHANDQTDETGVQRKGYN